MSKNQAIKIMSAMNLPTYSSLYIKKKKKLIVHWYENPNIPCVHWSAHVYHWFAIRFYHFHPDLTLRNSISLTFQLKKKKSFKK